MEPGERAEAIELDLVIEAIRRRYGHDLREYVRETVARRLQAALARSGLAHFGELQHRLLHDAGYFAALLDQLTVQVSDMFRDPPFYRVLRERVVPLLRTYPQLRIWHAGCASGEEVYATAILLAEEGLYERAQLYATDLSASAVETAKQGLYPAERLAEFAENYALAGGTGRFQDYCSKAYGRIAMREALRKNVVFFQHDLANDHAIGEMHVIFCRNVLLYFEGSLRQRVLELFAGSLRRGGFLCLGASEALPAPRDPAFTEFAAKERFFQRRGAA